MVQFFKKRQPLEARQAHRAALAERLADAENTVANARLAATELALEGGDDATLDKAEARIKSAMARLITLNEALTAMDTEIHAQAASEAADADKKLRTATATEIRKIIEKGNELMDFTVSGLRSI